MIPPLIIAGIAGASAIGLLRQRLINKKRSHSIKRCAELIGYHDEITPNARLQDGTPLLIKAIQSVEVNIVQELLEIGVNPDIYTPDGKPALFYVLENEQADLLLELFNEHHANFNIMDARGNTALFYVDSPKQIPASENGKSVSASAPDTTILKRIAFLCEAGALINAQNAEGKTPLHLAKSLDAVDGFIKNNADPNIRDKKPSDLFCKKTTVALPQQHLIPY